MKQESDSVNWDELKTTDKLDIIAEHLNIIPKENENGEDVKTSKKKEKEVKVKIFKPSFGWLKEAGMKKKNKVYVFLCKSNGQILCKIESIEDGMIEIDKKCYDATDAFKFVFKNKPAYIILEWRVHPVGKIDLEEAIKTGSIIHPQVITIRRIEKAILENKKMNMNWLLWVAIIGGVLVVGYLLINGDILGATTTSTTLAGG